MDAEVLQVVPPGTPLTVTGAAENGFVPVAGNGVNGWIDANLLGGGTDPALPPPVLASSMTGANTNLPAPETANVVPAPDPATTTSATDPALASIAPPPDTSTGQTTGIVWPFTGGEWEVVQGYNGGTHQNRGGFAQYYYSIDWARSDGNTAGQPIFAPVSGSIQWADRGSGGILIDAGNGYGVALFHITVDRSVSRGGSVERGQQIGVVSGPGGDGYMSMEHVEIAAWRLLDGGGHESVPFTGPNAIAGQEFPDTGGGNQYMGATVRP
jgi:murein DD-endopeptidase MepM/ murein hydrolase activator NlpD